MQKAFNMYSATEPPARSSSPIRLSVAGLIMGLVMISAVAGPVSGQIAADTAAIDSYFEVVESFPRGDSEIALQELNKVLTAFRKEGFYKGVLMVRVSLADLYRARGDYEKASVQLAEAREIMVQSRDIRGEGQVLLRMGVVETERSRLNEADKLFREGLANATAVEDRKLAADIRTQLGRLHIIHGNFSKAHEVLTAALKVHGSTNDKRREALDLSGLAEIHRIRNQYKTALDLLDNAVVRAKKAGRKSLEHKILVRKTETLRDQGNLKEAKKQIYRCLKFFSESGDQRAGARAETVLASVMCQEGLTEKAATRLQAAAKTLDKSEALVDRSHSMLYTGKALITLGRLPDAAKILDQALEIVTRLRVPYTEMLVRLAQARLQITQGRLQRARVNTDLALDLAKALGTRKGQIDAAAAKGFLRQQLEDDAGAVVSYDRALELNRSLGDARAERECLIARAHSLVRLGFLGRAEQDEETVKAGLDSTKDLACKGDLLFVRGLILAAGGDESGALKAYNQADVIIDKLSSPATKAQLAEAKAGTETALRNLEKAYSYWDRAEKIYASMVSPRGVIKCRAAKINLALDINDLSRARSVARRPLGVSWTRTSQARDLRDRVVSPGTEESPTARLIQYGPGLGPQGTDFGMPTKEDFRRPTYRSQPWTGDGYSAGKDPDAAIIGAHIHALRAVVAVASGDISTAKTAVDHALKVARSYKDDSAIARFNYLLARVLAEKGDYAAALEAFRKSGVSRGWRPGYVGAMTKPGKGRAERTAEALRAVIDEVMLTEKREGLWLVPPRVMRDREKIYEQYIGLLMEASRKSGAVEQARKAWEFSQVLKMRRTLYQLASIGVDLFPGTSPDLLKELKKQQYASANKSRRDRYPKLKKKYGVEAAAGLDLLPYGSDGRMESLLAKLSAASPLFFSFLQSRPPSVGQVESLLAKGEMYTTFLVTERSIHCFLLGATGFRAATAHAPAAKIRKAVLSLTKDVANPRHYRISKLSNDLWNQLFGSSQPALSSCSKLVIETDGFLNSFPFEALAPAPLASKAKQETPLLMDRVEVSRTSSAFRFVGQRSRKTSFGKAESVVVFAGPIFPSDVGTGKPRDDQDPLVPIWKRSLIRFKSSPVYKGSQQSAQIAAAFGKKGTLLVGQSASCRAFLKKQIAAYPFIHLACPLLIPATPAGRLRQPFIAFAPKDRDLSAGFCGIADIFGAPRATEVVSFAWVDRIDRASERGTTLLLEALGISGARWVLLPLWETDRRGEAEANRFLSNFYSSARDGHKVTEALREARARFQAEIAAKKRNRCNAVRFALF